MPTKQRLPPPYGSLINREKTITFSFEGKQYEGYSGDTIASALAANGRWVLSRSFKYHRPRGALTMAGQDANTLVQLPSNPNALADVVNISSELKVKGQNYFGSLENDLASILGLVSRFLPVGFYYKAFFKPRGIWNKWASVFRRIAGLGVIDVKSKLTYHDKQYLFFDIIVVGAGPAGLTAAITAGNAGAKVLLVDENISLGGSLNYSRLDVIGSKSGKIRNKLVEALRKNQNITTMCNATCNGWFADNWLPIISGKRLHKVRAKQTIFCVGSYEQHAVFHNNDLPGIILSSAAQRLMRLYGVKPSDSAVVLTGNNDGYATALELLDAGAKVLAVIDLRESPKYNSIAKHVSSLGIRIETGHTIYAAYRRNGQRQVGSVEIRKILESGICDDISEILHCDFVCMAVGYTPGYHLICQSGGQLSYDDDTCTFRLSNYPNTCQIAGSVNGKWELQAVLADAERAAMLACASLGFTCYKDGVTELKKTTVNSETIESAKNFHWPIFSHPLGKEFVDFDEDLQIKDIVNATKDGYEHIQLVKRYSTCGMGPSQGRHSALAMARLVAESTGKTVSQTGVTTARPPFSAETLAQSAGRSFYPARRTNIHYRHIEAGAQMLQAGSWYRPAFYGPKKTRDECINNEVINVRENVGIVDISTLGGIEIRGPQACEFMNRFYTSGFLKQPTGHSRYALLTNEAGVVIDDGVACKIGEEHFYVTTTSGGADDVYRSMLKWSAQWQLDVDIANVTSAYAGINIAGPASRELIGKVCSDVDFNDKAFPYMGVREGTVSGISARVIRVGFVGELGFEVHVPQHCGESLWNSLMLAGKAQSIMPFGIEAQRVLRLEKGHIIIGQDTDAMSTPDEVNMSWAISQKKPFFVGGRTIKELRQQAPARVLVGFIIKDSKAPVPLESHLVLEGDSIIGRVTSCAFSPTLRKVIGLAYVNPEKSKKGSKLFIKTRNKILVTAEIAPPPFYDPGNTRQDF